MKKLIQFVKEDTVLCIAWVLAFLTMFLVPPSAAYLDYIDTLTCSGDRITYREDGVAEIRL